MDVLQHEDKGVFLGERLEELAVGPERFLPTCGLLGVGRTRTAVRGRLRRIS